MLDFSELECFGLWLWSLSDAKLHGFFEIVLRLYMFAVAHFLYRNVHFQ